LTFFKELLFSPNWIFQEKNRIKYDEDHHRTIAQLIALIGCAFQPVGSRG